MKIIETREAKGPALDWLVTTAQGLDHFIAYGKVYVRKPGFDDPDEPFYGAYHYSPSGFWSQGGQIIDQEKITTHCFDGVWIAVIFERSSWGIPKRREEPVGGLFGEFVVAASAFGFDSIEAAMRAYVVSKFGDKVSIPEELL